MAGRILNGKEKLNRRAVVWVPVAPGDAQAPPPLSPSTQHNAATASLEITRNSSHQTWTLLGPTTLWIIAKPRLGPGENRPGPLFTRSLTRHARCTVHVPTLQTDGSKRITKVRSIPMKKYRQEISPMSPSGIMLSILTPNISKRTKVSDLINHNTLDILPKIFKVSQAEGCAGREGRDVDKRTSR